MTRHDTTDEAALDRLFAAASDLRPAPPADLMARIMADAAAALPRPAPALPPPPVSLWKSVLATIGGWPTMGGLATAMAGDALTVDLLATEDPLGLAGG